MATPQTHAGPAVGPSLVMPQQNAPEHPVQNIHILLVDDERLSRVVVANLLRKCHYTVTVAESGGQAMELLRDKAPGTFQLVLTDVMMPQVDGIELLRYVRSHKELGDLPVVMMSASEHAETMFQCIRGGAEEYLVKPVTQKEIQKIWTHVVKRASGPGTAGPATAPSPGAAGTSAQHQNGTAALHSNHIVLSPPQQEPAPTKAAALPMPVSLSQLQIRPPLPPGAGAGPPAVTSGLHAPTVGAKRKEPEVHNGTHQPGVQTGRRAGAEGGGVGSGVHSMSLRAWLGRPSRKVQQAECLWVFAEVMLLLESVHETPGATLGPRLRPSQLLLHSNGTIALASDAHTAALSQPPAPQQAQAGTGITASQQADGASSAATHAAQPASSTQLPLAADQLEAQAYLSPEEQAGQERSQASDMFAAGLILLELFSSVRGKEVFGPGWQTMMAAARQGHVPADITDSKGQEAAFILSLLHSDPGARPSVATVLQHDALRRTLAAVKQRRAAAAAPAAAATQPAPTPSPLSDALAPARHTPSPPAPKPQVDLDSALLGDFLTIMHSRKRAELSAAESSLAALEDDIATLESALQVSLEEERAAQRRRTGPSRMHSFNLGSGGSGGLGSPTAAGRGSSLAAWPSNDLGSVGRLLDSAAQPAASVGTMGTAVGTAGGIPGLTDPDTQKQVVQQRWQRISGNRELLETLYLARRTNSLASAVFHGPSATPNTATAADQASTPHATNGHHTGDKLNSQPAAAANDHGTGPPPAGNVRGSEGRVAAGLASVPDYMSQFADDLNSFTRHRRLRMAASMQHGDTLSSGHMVCCIAFDRDDEFFATAGVSKRVRIYELQRVLRAGGVAGGFPVQDLSSRSRLSSVCWSSYIKSQLAAADYEGVVSLWDVSANTELMQFEEHAKRVWAVDMCRNDPTRLASASDDGTVRVWAINQENSVACLQCGANVCSVQWNPESSHLLALGAANCWAAVYDLRYAVAPLYNVAGHQKAVSYVRHASPTQLVTASTDNTIRKWELPLLSSRLGGQGDATQAGANGKGLELVPVRPGAQVDPHPNGQPAGAWCALGSKPQVPQCSVVYKGHVNERNFVGLSVSSDGYIACGSEDNSVVCYHKSLPLPMLTHSFSDDPLEVLHPPGMRHHHGSSAALADRDQGATSSGPNCFVSSVCWAQSRSVLLAANSLGVIRLLQLD